MREASDGGGEGIEEYEKVHGQGGDYLLTTQEPSDKREGHYLEFVSQETHTVQAGETLWGIARRYFRMDSHSRFPAPALSRSAGSRCAI